MLTKEYRICMPLSVEEVGFQNVGLAAQDLSWVDLVIWIRWHLSWVDIDLTFPWTFLWSSPDPDLHFHKSRCTQNRIGSVEKVWEVNFHSDIKPVVLSETRFVAPMVGKYEVSRYSVTLHVQQWSHLASLHWEGQKNWLVWHCLKSTTHVCCQTRWTWRLTENIDTTS